MEIINTIFYFLIVIGVLVFIHEFGHFIAARIMGMRTEVFAFGMGFRLLGFNKKNGFTFGRLPKNLELENNTDYRLCAFPIGGYVKISGMIDESMDKEFVNKEPKPWEFRSKPVWKRMIVITAGVIMNLVLAFIIFYLMTLIKGKSYTETTTIGYVSANSIAAESGFKAGDKIISVNNNEVTYWEELQSQIYIDNIGEALDIKYIRDGNVNYIHIPKDKLKENTDKSIGISPANVKVYINNVLKEKPADSIGLMKNDLITAYNGEKINSPLQLVDMIKSSTGKESVIEWSRNNEIFTSKISPLPDSTIGVEISGKYEGNVKEVSFNIFSAFPRALDEMYYYGIEIFFNSVYKIIKGDVPFRKAIGGPVKIAQASAQSAEGGFFPFIGFLALLSISLAIINILPFPALDGGHFIILLYEGIFKKPIPYKIQIVIQNVGLIILLAFMLFVIYNDIISIK